jgi:hypothetical protein
MDRFTRILDSQPAPAKNNPKQATYIL